MLHVILVIHLLLAIAMVAVIMLQRSEGGALGIGGGGGGGLMTGRAAGNLLTRTTGILAAAFMLTSVGLAILANNREAPASILDRPMPAAPAPVAPEPVPAAPAVPAPPLAR